MVCSVTHFNLGSRKKEIIGLANKMISIGKKCNAEPSVMK